MQYNNIPETNILLTRSQAAELLGVKPSTLATWTTTKRYNLPYVKVGRLVKYRLSDIEEFIQRQTKNGGAQ